MKKICNGKLYDTDTARLLGKRKFEGDDYSCLEELYLTSKNRYFSYRKETSGFYEGEFFEILSEEEAKTWAERNLSVEEYCKIFGVPEEG